MRKFVAVADEGQWIERAQAGDREAFAALVERYWGRVHRWLLNLVPQAQTAEDLTQDVFLKAWAGLPALRTPEQFRGWLFRIARNCLIDQQRAKRPETPLPGGVAGNEPGPLTQALHKENERLLAEACARLPALFRAPFLLWTQENLSHAQIAEALDITEETARWRVFKARQFLVRALRGHLDKRKP